MIAIKSIRLITIKEAMRRRGRKSSQHYADIQMRIAPPTIHIGNRGVRHIEHEIEAVIRAEVAGKSVDEIKSLIEELIANRPILLDQCLDDIFSQKDSK